jgi:hypothetical protein
VHARQAYFGRRVTITRGLTGILSRRSDVLANDIQHTAAASACLGLGLDDDFLARPVGRKVVAVGTPIVDTLAPGDPLFFGNRVLGAERCLHLL